MPPGIVVVSTRRFDRPRETVFRAFADPKQLAKWWGPRDFTHRFETFELRPGGAWSFVMQGPAGEIYENVSEFVEVVPPERIVFDHLRPVHRFRMTMTFEETKGLTLVTWHMALEPKSDYERWRSIIVEANEQNFDRLGLHLETLPI